jgi:hypothetical protein
MMNIEQGMSNDEGRGSPPDGAAQQEQAVPEQAFFKELT